jgi:hypothetical protein
MPPFIHEEEALLSTMSDQEVAERTGRPFKVVTAYRKRMSIPSFREQNGYEACRGR